MVPKIEASIRVGTTGTIAALINHEIESSGNSILQKPSTKGILQKMPPPTSKKRPQTVPVSIHCGGVLAKKQQQPPQRTAQSGNMSTGKSRGKVKKLQINNRLTAHRIPILSSGDVSVDSTPERPKGRGYGIVEVVDLKCGNHDKEWSRPITDQFKRLSFSRIID